MYEIQDIVHPALFSVVLVFNIAGNSLVIHFITNERGMKTSTNFLLLNLAVADLLFGVFLAPKFIFLPFFRDSVPDGVLGEWLCKLLLSGIIAWMAANVSLFTILTLSMERYFAVCRPHSFRQRFSLRNIKIFILIYWIYSFLWSLPITIWLKRDVSKQVVCKQYENFTSKLHAICISVEMCLSVLLMVFPLVRICSSLWCKQTIEPTGQREITERKRKKKVTFCVLAVVVAFLLCWVPCYIVYVLRVLSNHDQSRTNSSGNFVLVLMMAINAALNPLLYRFSSFRSIFKKNICRRSTRQSRIANSSEYRDNNQNVLS